VWWYASFFVGLSLTAIASFTLVSYNAIRQARRRDLG
jgi:hypothetical protein